MDTNSNIGSSTIQIVQKEIGSVIYLHGITDSKVSGLNYARELDEAVL